MLSVDYPEFGCPNADRREFRPVKEAQTAFLTVVAKVACSPGPPPTSHRFATLALVRLPPGSPN